MGEPIDIDAIEVRANAATAGPWTAEHRHVMLKPDADEFCGLGLEINGPPESSGRGQFARGADALFIASARTDVPALCAALRDRDAEIAQADRAEALLYAAGFGLADVPLDVVVGDVLRALKERDAEIAKLREQRDFARREWGAAQSALDHTAAEIRRAMEVLEAQP